MENGKIEFHPIAISYMVEIDRIAFANKLIHDDESFYEALDKIEGVNDIDYNGHFGPYIYLTIDLDVNVPETLEKIKKLIQEMIYEI